MDFFEAQDQARSKTKTLVFLFILAVFAMGSLIYLGVSYLLYSQMDPPLPIWDLERLIWILGSVIAFVGLCSIWKINSLKEGGSSIARMLGGTAIPANPDDPKLKRYRNVVEEMAIASGIRIPEIFLLQNESSINAFAAGYTQDNAAVAVSQGCLDQLDRDELQGVIAHEYSHILNGDMRINTRLIGIIFGLLALAVLGRIVLRTVSFRGSRRSRRNSKNGGGVLVIFAIAAIVMIVGYVGVLFGRLIQSAISRQREFLADSSAVQFTRNPGGIANALRKIKLTANGSRIQNPDALEASHLFFANALSRPFASAFATHPPLDERIKAIDPHGTTEKALQPVPAASVSTTPPGPRKSSPDELVSNLGSIDQESLNRTHALLNSLPESLVSLSRDPLKAHLVLLAAMGNSNGPSELRTLTLQQRHALTEIALATIKELPPASLETRLRDFRRYASADGVIDFDEQCLLITIERSIQSFHTNNKSAHKTFPQTRESIEIVLSAIAQDEAENDVGAQKSFAQGTIVFNGFGAHLTPRFDQARGQETLNAAILTASESNMNVRKRIVLAAAKIITSDNQLTPSELRRIGSLCAALDCPIPPLN